MHYLKKFICLSELAPGIVAHLFIFKKKREEDTS